MKRALMFFHIIFFFSAIYSQDVSIPAELYFNNYSNTKDIEVSIYPVSQIFNEKDSLDFVAIERDYLTQHGTYYTYNNGVGIVDDIKKYSLLIHSNTIYDQKGFNFDLTTTNEYCFGSLGYGLYKIIITPTLPDDNYGWFTDTLWIEYDASGSNDLDINFRDDGNNPRVTYNITESAGSCEEWLISAVDRYLKVWQPYGPYPPSCWGGNLPHNYGNFTFYNNNNFYDYVFPLDSRRDCNLPNLFGNPTVQDQRQSFSSNQSGRLTLNCTILYPGAWTPYQDKRLDFPTYITVMPGSSAGPKLSIGESAYFYLYPDSWYTSTNHSYTVLNDYNIVSLSGVGSSIKVGNHNQFNMYTGSKITSVSKSNAVEIEQGGLFCNYGGTIIGPVKFYFDGTNRCAAGIQDFLVKDSTQIILQDSSSWQLEDSSIVTIDSTSSLIMKPHSEIRFGKGAKLILQHGSRISASYASFLPLDSTETWDGIYLNDLAQDTITNCTIENSTAGINIINRSSASISPPPYSAIITNCTFTNTTSATQLTNAIYANNSDNLLIQNDSIRSNITEGYISGITLDYCGAGTIDVMDNNISNVSSGLTIIHTSPYIARNNISGSSNVGYGISLDNVNGIIKFNKTKNFTYSLSGDYSSPYLLKNTFDSAYNRGIYIKTTSIPVMKPISSGSTLRWLGGNNTVSGHPSTSGLWFGTSAYPLIDSGYNNIIVNGSDYMAGTIPSSLSGVLPARLNYWQDAHPSSGKFNITSATTTYTPVYDGSSVPSTNGTELNSIGFGLYDTVYTESGDNPSSDALFIQGYIAETEADYSTAITKYKDGISGDAGGAYASISLYRIFNCLEKSRSNASAYSSIQSYYNGIKNDTNYSTQTRESAEDLAIKSKYRQGNIEDAISDYNTMYTNNQYTPKGVHALINKECLESMSSGGDNMSPGLNTTKIARHLHNLYALAYGDNIFKSIPITNIPLSYTLYQNYPNPFNPTTTIRYDIPKAGMVSIKIYDILGRQLYSASDFRAAGHYEMKFDASNYASGLYFYRIEAGSFAQTKKMVLVK